MIVLDIVSRQGHEVLEFENRWQAGKYLSNRVGPKSGIEIVNVFTVTDKCTEKELLEEYAERTKVTLASIKDKLSPEEREYLGL